MNIIEFYCLIFVDTFFANLIFIVTGEIALATVKTFQNYAPFLALPLAISASMLAYSVNYYLGKVVFQIVRPFQKEEGQVNMNNFKKLEQNKIFSFIFFLSAMFFYGKFIIFFTGFAKFSYKKIITITFIAKLLYYSYFLII